jgi:hypothetical protein
MTFAGVNLPAWAAFNVTTGELSGTPTDSDIGTYSNIQIGVSVGGASASLAPFSIVVKASALAPTISGTPATNVPAGQAYLFDPTASDPNTASKAI